MSTSEVIKKIPDFNYELKTFTIISISALLLLGILVLTTAYGIAFLLLPLSLLFIVRPASYVNLKMQNVSIKLLYFSDKVLSKLNFLPGVDFQGEWYIEPEARRDTLTNPIKVAIFLVTRFFEVLFISIGFMAFLLRVFYVIMGSPEEGPIILVTESGTFLLLIGNSLIGVLGLVFYMNWVWVWRDAGLKKVVFKESTKGRRREIVSMKPASTSAMALMGYFSGLGAWFWLFKPQWMDAINELFGATVESADDSPSWIGDLVELVFFRYGVALLLIFFAIVMLGGPLILMAVSYLRSGVHEYFVNNLRYHVRKGYTENLLDEVPCIYCDTTGQLEDVEEFIDTKAIALGTSLSVEISSNYVGKLGNQAPVFPKIDLDQAIPIIEEKGIMCPRCNNSNPKDRKFCVHCGLNLMETNRFCVSCGYENEGGKRFCRQCGSSLIRRGS